jgi:hypothetical protein
MVGVLTVVIGIGTSVAGFLTAVVKLKKELQDRHDIDEGIRLHQDSRRRPWSAGQTVLYSTLFGLGGGAFFGTLLLLVVVASARDSATIAGVAVLFAIPLTGIGTGIGLKVGFKLAGSEKERQDRLLAEIAALANRQSPAHEPPPPPPQEPTFFYSRQGQSEGPVAFDQLRHLAATGQLRPEHHVFHPARRQWVRAGKVRALFPAAIKKPGIPVAEVLDSVAEVLDLLDGPDEEPGVNGR